MDSGRLLQVLREWHPDFVGISVRNIDDVLIRKQETFFGELAELTAAIRVEASCPVILGGSGFSIFPKQLLELAQADFGIAGPGEAGFLRLISALKNGTDYSGIPGLVFREDGKVIVNGAAPAGSACALDLCDRPASIAAYYIQQGSMLNLQTQRGCSFRCCYCTYPLVEGRRRRRQQPEFIANDFERLQRLGARYVFIVDSVFNSSARHVTETCEALLRRKLRLPWGCFLRPQGLTPDLMRLMAGAGLTHIEFGSDSFCDEVLAAYRKDFTFEEVRRASELAWKEKIDFCHFLIAGGPGETEATLEKGFENSQRIPGAVILAVVGMRIYPGTRLHTQAIAEGRISRKTNLLKPVYYLAPGLTEEDTFAKIADFARRSPNWLVGDPDPGYQRLVNRLRQRGLAGPLWSYFAMLQRLQARKSP